MKIARYRATRDVPPTLPVDGRSPACGACQGGDGKVDRPTRRRSPIRRSPSAALCHQPWWA